MDNNNQGNPNNQNSTGISGFGATPNNDIPRVTSVFPPAHVSASVLPAAPAVPVVPTPAVVNPVNNQPKPQPQTSSIQTQISPPSTPPKSNPIPATLASGPNTTNQVPEMPTGLESKQNFTKQSIIGGVEEPKPKSKTIFSLPSIGLSTKKADQSVEQNSTTPTAPPSYNEITAPGVRSKFALIAIIVGTVLLVAAGAGYYYLSYMNKKAQEAAEETQPIVEQPAVPENIEDSTIDMDAYVVQFTQLEASPSIAPSDLKKQIQSIDIQNIDLELMPQGEATEQTQPTTTESEPPAQL